MLESTYEVVCPTCKTPFFPQTRAGKKVLCGEELSKPEQGGYTQEECRLYYFCSENCIKQFEETHKTDIKTSRLKRFLEHIGDASSRCGINENVRCHVLHKVLKD